MKKSEFIDQIYCLMADAITAVTDYGCALIDDTANGRIADRQSDIELDVADECIRQIGRYAIDHFDEVEHD